MTDEQKSVIEEIRRRLAERNTRVAERESSEAEGERAGLLGRFRPPRNLPVEEFSLRILSDGGEHDLAVVEITVRGGEYTSGLGRVEITPAGTVNLPVAPAVNTILNLNSQARYGGDLYRGPGLTPLPYAACAGCRSKDAALIGQLYRGGVMDAASIARRFQLGDESIVRAHAAHSLPTSRG